MSLYSTSYIIVKFRQDIRFSNTSHKEDVFMETCLETERASMGDLSAPYFYLHFPIINELRVMIPFTPFEAYFMVTVNVSPPKSCPTYEVSLGLSRSSFVIWATSIPSRYSFLFMA